MKNLNLNEQEKQRGWHDFCSINHANQTEVQADTLSASGRSAVSVTLEECPANNALITRLSRANHALFPLSRCVNTLIRIGDYVVGGRARRGAGKEVVAMMRQKCMMWKYAAMVVLMVTLGVGEMWGRESTLYCAISEATLGENHVLIHVNHKGNGNAWGDAATMTNTGKTYNGKVLLSATFKTDYDGLGALYLKLMNSSDVQQDYIKVFGDQEWTEPDVYENKIWEWKEDGWRTYAEDKDIYIYGDEPFSSVYLYTFDPGRNGDWPGSEQTSLGSNWYKVSIDGSAKFILNNNSGKQTNDLFTSNVDEGKSYHFVSDDSKYKLEEKKLTITANMHDHGSASFSPVYYNGLITEVTPSVTGYTFGGWYKESTYNNLWNFSADHVTSDVTLHAKWTPKTTALTLAKNDGTGTTTSTTATYDATISVTPPSRTGYNFTGYYTAGGSKIIDTDGHFVSSAVSGFVGSGQIWRSTESSLTLTARWTAQTYTAANNLDKNGGDSHGQYTATYDATTIAISPAPAKTGYDVEGYYKEAECNNKIADAAGNLQTSTDYTDASSHWTSTSNQTLYAKWTANTYTISFDADDASRVGDATNVQSNVTVTYNDNNFSAATVAVPVLAGYTFGGYYTEANGGGEQIVDANGAWITSAKTGYLDASGNWIKADNTTLYAKWTPQTYTVTLNYGMGAKGDNPASVTATMGATYASSTGLLSSALPTVADPSGYYFTGWYSAAEGGDKIENTTIVEKAYDHTIYAQFTPITYVYFYNNLGWSNVYVTYDAYWDENGSGAGNSKGSGNKGKIYHQMTPIATGSPIYRDQVPEDIIRSWKYNICFNDTKMGEPTGSSWSGTYENFNGGKAVFRRDFDSYATMFVPHNANSFPKNDPFTTYQSSAQWVDHQDNDEKKDIIDYRYQDGYWMVYNASDAGEAGYVLKGTWDSEANDFYFKKTAAGNDYTVTKYLPAGQTYNFRIYKHCKTSNTYSSWFINNSGNTIKTSVSDYSLNTAIAKSETTKYDHLKTSVAGDYTFTLTCGEDGILKLSVKYPDLTADADWYRLLYTWNDGSAHSRVCETFQRPDNDGETEWTDAFIHHQDGTTIKSRSLKLQKYVTVSSTPTWSDVQTIDLSSITKNGVYTFKITRASGAEAVVSYVRPFEGDYYLRSDITDGGWDYYIGSKQVMTYSDYSTTLQTDPYSHYYCKYINNDENRSVAFTVATANTPSLCDTLVGDAIIGAGDATLYKRLPSGNPANVRFMYNENTNTIKRAYLKSAQGTGNTRYLVLHGTDHVFKSDGTDIDADVASSLAANELLFTDKGNWVYEIHLKASPIAKAKVIARYNGSDESADRYLVGGSGDTAADWKVILGGDEDTGHKYDLSGVYDFKTNRLMMAWKPTGEAISAKLSDVDMLWVREGDKPAQQIKFSGSGELKDVDVIGAIKFDKTGTNGFVGSVGEWNATTRPKLKYFISFPFDVAVSDIFGFNKATYGDEYVVQKYNGAARAEKGLFAGDDGTFWEDLTTDSIMHANEGYCLIMDNEYLNDGSHAIWENVPSSGSIYLYFPATAKVASISGTTTTTTVKEHTYRFDRPWASNPSKNHNITDSHWNLIGSPLFQNTTFVGSSTTLTSYYRWHYDNTWKPWVTSGEAGTNAGSSNVLKAMNCIMVQWHGTISWSKTESDGPATPASFAARRTSEKKNHTLKLELLRNEEPVDWAFVEMRDGAQKDFVLCEDMMKIQNSGKPNLYLYAGGYDVAYSQVPVETQTVPVGVIIRQNGTYTFSMPSNFDGTVTLIDKFAQTRTNLALGDYEVALERGTINDRFELEINIRNVPTAIDGVTDGSGSLKDGKAHKFIENGVLYIVKDGQVFDARGNKVK